MRDRILLRDTLANLVESGLLDQAGWRRGRELAGLSPGPADWRQFLERLLLIGGVALLAAGAVFFVASGWQALARGDKFLLLEALLLATVAVAGRLGLAQPAGRSVLGLAVGVLGALLALFGQIYQTGADSYELFVAWAALALPWVLAGRSAAITALWWSILNLGIYLALTQRWFGASSVEQLLFGHWDRNLALQVVALGNALTAAVAEVWLRQRGGSTVFARVVALYALAAASLLAIEALLEARGGWAAALIFVPVVGAALVGYRQWRFDLPLLAATALALLVVSVITAFRLLNGNIWSNHGLDGGIFILLMLYTVGASAAAAFWLNRLRRYQP